MDTFKFTFLFLVIGLFSCEDPEPDIKIKTPIPVQTQSVVFIAGFDEDDNTFYKNAKAHFSQQALTIVEDIHSIEDIIIWLNANADDKTYDKIHIVSHSNAWRGMALKTCEEGQRITLRSLKQWSFTKPNASITADTDIIFHSCGLGANRELMKTLKMVFTSDASPNVYASEYFNVFGGKFASHYLAQPFYVFYPTAHSPGNKALSEEIAHKNPSVIIDWLTALGTREETAPGAVYSYRFNIPVDWDIVFEDETDIPKLKSADAIMDFILDTDELSFALYELGIPMEKFRWDSEIHDNTLKIKGKTTVLSVLIPVMDSYVPAEYSVPDITHPRLYTKF